MNKKIQRIVASLTLLGVLWAPASANAGFFDWLLGNKSSSVDTQNESSFDSVYKGVTNNKEEDNKAVREDGILGLAMTIAPKLNASRVRSYTVQASGYSSTVDQTDDKPFITASGTTVRDGVVASNMFPIGTVIRIPKIYGDKLFVVEDRMNRRYQNNVDLWFSSREEAKQFGRRTVVVEVVAYLD